jgi:hypothetical protein
MFLSSVNTPIPCVKEFTANIITLEIDTPLTTSEILMVHSKGMKVLGKITKIIEIYKGEKSFKKP